MGNMVGNLLGSVLHVAAKIRKLRRRISPTFRRKHAIRQSIRTALYDVIWQRVAAKIEGSIESMPGGFARISVGNATTFVRRSQVCLDNYLTLQLAGNKPLVYQLLNDMQITCLPDYCTYRCTEISTALKFLETKGGPMVVKPAAGTGAGAGVTTGISSGMQLLRATILAASFCNDLLIEKQFRDDSRGVSTYYHRQ